MPLDVEFAKRIADQLQNSRQPRTWRKVTTILSAYDAHRLTDGVRQSIAEGFEAAGLRAEPSMLDVDRSSSVRLSLASADVDVTRANPSSSNGTDGHLLPAGVTVWAPGDEAWAPATSISATGGLVLVDIDLSLANDSASLYTSLPAVLSGLTKGVLDDLLTPDPRAAFKRYGAKPVTRQASLFVVTTNDDVVVDEENAVLLSLALIEFAIGRDWLLVARHPAQVHESGRPKDDVQARSKTAARYVASLQSCGLARASTAEAAALAIITQGVDSFARARTEFASYVDSWRTDFADGLNDRSLLLNLQATLPLVVDALEPLRRPTVVEWLDSEPRDRARDLNDHVDHNLDALHSLQQTTAEALAQADQHQNEVYQGSLATLAAVLLAPALVASIFGANQALEDSRLDLVWLFVAMLVAGLATFYVIRRKTAAHQRR